MKIGVCIKQVPDTETKIRINDSKSWISEEGVKFVINPYDEFALEEAIKTREKFSGEVVVITVGPKRCQESIRTALAMGADRAVHVLAEDHKLDPMTLSRVLKEVVVREGIEFVLAGKQAVDNDFSAVGPMLAEMLDWSSANVVVKTEFSADGKTLTVEREVQGGAREIMDLSLPAVITATKGLNNPRYPSLKGIMQAKKKEIKETGLEELRITGAGQGLALENLRLPPDRKQGQIIEGEPKEAAAKLVSLLRNEAKVI